MIECFQDIHSFILASCWHTVWGCLFIYHW